eukprot:TRINITY_DN2884_c0_g1_i1.p1 TRINITY_DN2884_c0_g1~~TRINITY_DN2884_c0_g1_i1.p1  ORF type:complete len:255 (-),score=38.22 TRINITY_DN2884_c0_g1_i1:52-777(-)
MAMAIAVGARVHVIRHGESEWNRARGWDTRTDPMIFDARLTERGRQQALALNARVALQMRPDLVLCSPLSRCLETAYIALGRLCGTVPVRVLPLIREVQLNSCDIGRPASVLHSEFPWADFSNLPELWWHSMSTVYTSESVKNPEMMAALRLDYASNRLAFTEPKESAETRVVQFVDYLRSEACAGHRSIVVFAHGDFLFRLCGRWLSNCAVADATESLRTFTVPHTWNVGDLYDSYCLVA